MAEDQDSWVRDKVLYYSHTERSMTFMYASYAYMLFVPLKSHRGNMGGGFWKALHISWIFIAALHSWAWDLLWEIASHFCPKGKYFQYYTRQQKILPWRVTLSLSSKAVSYTYVLEYLILNRRLQCLCSQNEQQCEPSIQNYLSVSFTLYYQFFMAWKWTITKE